MDCWWWVGMGSAFPHRLPPGPFWRVIGPSGVTGWVGQALHTGDGGTRSAATFYQTTRRWGTRGVRLTTRTPTASSGDVARWAGVKLGNHAGRLA